MTLDRNAILNVSDLKRQEVQVPEWGGSVYVRTLTGTQRDAFEGRFKGDVHKDVRAYVAVNTVCDGEGNLLFTEADLAALGNKSGAALDRIFEAALSINKVSAGDIEALEKN